MIVLRMVAGNNGNHSIDWIECALCVLVISLIAVPLVQTILELRKENGNDRRRKTGDARQNVRRGAA